MRMKSSDASDAIDHIFLIFVVAISSSQLEINWVRRVRRELPKPEKLS